MIHEDPSKISQPNGGDGARKKVRIILIVLAGIVGIAILLGALLYLTDYNFLLLDSQRAENPKYRCENDSDCTVTCSRGAINKEWIDAELERALAAIDAKCGESQSLSCTLNRQDPLNECFDGCALGGEVRCVQGQCAKFSGKKIDKDCTLNN